MDKCDHDTGQFEFSQDPPQTPVLPPRVRVVVHLDDNGRWTATRVHADNVTGLGGSYENPTQTRFDARLLWGELPTILVRGPLALAMTPGPAGFGSTAPHR